jgi:hypothetical protein
MDNPTLNCERFAASVNQLSVSFAHFGLVTETSVEAIRQFSASVDKMVAALGMQAENEQRLANGHSIAYDESAFNSL